MENVKSLPYKECDGLRIPPVFSPEAFRSGINYKHQPGQFFLVTYPKTGSTWLQHIIMLILRKGQPIQNEFDWALNTPILEMAGAEAVTMMNGPGVIKYHLPYHMLCTSPEAKYIYIARNPRDCCVSYYYFAKMVPCYYFQNGTFDEFFEIFITGETDYGDYFDNLLSWYEHKNDPNVHFVTFETLKKDTKGEILKLAKFMGDEYYNAMMADAKYIENVLHYSSLDYMKKKVNDEMDNLIAGRAKPTDDTLLTPGLKYFFDSFSKYDSKNNTSDIKFVRKGIVGDWKNHCSPEQEERMKQWIKKRTEGSDVMSLWKDVEA